MTRSIHPVRHTRRLSLRGVFQSFSAIFLVLQRDLVQVKGILSSDAMIAAVCSDNLLPSKHKQPGYLARVQATAKANEVFASYLEDILGHAEVQSCPEWQSMLWGGTTRLMQVYCTHGYCSESALHLVELITLHLLNFERTGLQDIESDDSCKETALQILSEVVYPIGETIVRIRSTTTPNQKIIGHRPNQTDRLELERFQGASDRIEKYIHLALGYQSTLPPVTQKTLNLPYHNVSHDMISDRYFGRVEYISRITAGLFKRGGRRYSHLALHGLPGVGKTQLALRYAQQCASDYDVVIYTAATSEQKIRESFARAASGLGLPGSGTACKIKERSHNLLSWLENTGKRWLIIYDNVDDLQVLEPFKIASSRGDVLITSRDPRSGVSPVKEGIAVQPFSAQDSIEFFLQASGQHTMQHIPSTLKRLLIEWDGLPLALDQMSSYVREKSLSLTSFSTMYRRCRTRIHSSQASYASRWGYKNTMATAFSIHSLKDDARLLIHALSFLDPDRFFDETALIGDEDEVGVILNLFQDPVMFLDAREELIKFSLIQTGPDCLKIHRLVQAVAFDSMGERERHDMYCRILHLIWAAYPRVNIGDSLKPDWERCERYSSHMSYLLDGYRLLSHGPGCTAREELFELIGTCTWYFFETGKFCEADRLLQDMQPLLRDDPHSAKLRFSLAGIRNECNRPHEAKEQMDKVIEIEERRLEPDDLTLGNVYYSAGIVHMECGDLPSAFAFHKKAFEVQDRASLKGIHDQDQVAATHANLSYCHRKSGDMEKAIYHAEKAYELHRKASGEMTGQFAELCFDLGNVRLEEGNRQESRTLHLRGLEIRRAIMPKHDKMGFSLHKMATLCEQDGEFEKALIYITEAIDIFKDNFDPIPRMSRSKFKQAQILASLGKPSEALQARKEAIQMRDSITTFEFTPDETETAYDSLVCSWFR